MDAGICGQPLGSFGDMYWVPTQQDLTENKRGHKVCVWGSAASFKRIFIRQTWRHHPVPFAIHNAAEQRLACWFWNVLTLCLGNSWWYVDKTPLKNYLHLRNTKSDGQGRHIYTESWFLSCCECFREKLKHLAVVAWTGTCLCSSYSALAAKFHSPDFLAASCWNTPRWIAFLLIHYR